jgi:transcriptional regulator
MYPPKYYQTNKEEIQKLNAVINDNPLATLLININETLPHVSHIPFHFSECKPESEPECDLVPETESKVLIAHVSNHHPLAKKLLTQKHVQVSLVFHGEQGYISPHCHDKIKVNIGGQNVPTWNYAKVHVIGIAKPILSPEGKYQQMKISSQYFEREQEKPWKLTEVPDKKIRQMLTAITFFKVKISRIEGSFKLSQNKPEQVKKQIAEQLLKKDKAKLAAQIL